MEWEPEEQAWHSYINFELRYKELDRARTIYERYILSHSTLVPIVVHHNGACRLGRHCWGCYPSPFHVLKFLQLIRRSGTHRFHPRRMSCWDLLTTWYQGTRIEALAMTAGLYADFIVWICCQESLSERNCLMKFQDYLKRYFFFLFWI